MLPGARLAPHSPPGVGAASRRIASPRMHGDILLEVLGLTATVDSQMILKGIDLRVRRGEVHAIMGPNGSGKSTLSKVLVGHPAYEVSGGSVVFDGNKGFLVSTPQERAQQGVFIAFQYPVEIPGVSNNDFLRIAVNKRRHALGLPEYDPIEFVGVLSQKMQSVSMSPDFLSRDVNSGFSGGEKKRNEILQMALLRPRLAILDETDSGLDIDALKTVADGINSCKSNDNAFVLITHYQRLLEYVKPDYVHVMHEGRIVKTGGPELAHELEAEGYAFLGGRCGRDEVRAYDDA